jgi:hypothetical protein
MESMAALQQEVNALKREILRKDKELVRRNTLLMRKGIGEKESKWLEPLNRVNELGTPRCRSNERDEKGSKWLEVLNRVNELDTNKLDTNKLEMESQCSVSDLHHPFRASDRQISPRFPKTHYNYDKIRRMQAGSDGQEVTDQSLEVMAQLILARRSPRNVGSLDRELDGNERLAPRQPFITSSSSEYRSFVSTLPSSVKDAVERTLEKQYQSNHFVVSSSVCGQAQLSHDQTTAQLVRSTRKRAAVLQHSKW